MLNICLQIKLILQVMNIRCILWISIFGLMACGTRSGSPLPETGFVELTGNTVHLNEGPPSIKAFMFLTYDCPLSVSYTGTMNRLTSAKEFDSVDFYYVFPGLTFPDDSVFAFAERYRLGTRVIFDPGYQLTRALHATVTPQIIITDSGGQIAYSGAVDDWAFAPGKKRQNINHHYAHDALEKLLKGQEPNPAATEPIGCFIEL